MLFTKKIIRLNFMEEATNNLGNVRNLIKQFDQVDGSSKLKNTRQAAADNKTAAIQQKILIPDEKKVKDPQIIAVSQEFQNRLKGAVQDGKLSEEGFNKAADTAWHSVTEKRKLPSTPMSRPPSRKIPDTPLNLPPARELPATPNTKTTFIATRISSQNHLEKVKSRVANFFQSVSNSFLFIGYAREVSNKSFIQKYELKKQKTGKSFEDELIYLKAEVAKAKSFGDPKIISQLNVKIAVLEKNKARLDKINLNEKKGTEVREQMRILGGERITIKTSDKVNLDGMYLDAKKFRETLKNARGTLVTYEIKVGDNKGKKLQGISLPKETLESSGEKVLNALKLLHGIPDDKNLGAGWTPVKDGDNILLVRSEDIPPENLATENPFFSSTKQDKMWVLNDFDLSSVEKNSEAIDENQESAGTVILTSGNNGIYEMSKEEALSFLFKNMNVVLFNFRGYGKSEGIPSKAGLEIDMESAYQLAKSKSGHEDSKILFKALCMSGGPAALVASKHPETNIFLDQSYSSFRELIKEQIAEKLEKQLISILGEPEAETIKRKVIEAAVICLSEVANLVTQFFIPSFNTSKYLEKNKGQKALLFTHDDDMISFKHLENNLKAIAKNLEMHNTTIFSAPGEHGESLLDIQASPLDYNQSEDVRKKIRETLNT